MASTARTLLSLLIAAAAAAAAVCVCAGLLQAVFAGLE
jgi:hypothetical protein